MKDGHAQFEDGLHTAPELRSQIHHPHTDCRLCLQVASGHPSKDSLDLPKGTELTEPGISHQLCFLNYDFGRKQEDFVVKGEKMQEAGEWGEDREWRQSVFAAAGHQISIQST